MSRLKVKQSKLDFQKINRVLTTNAFLRVWLHLRAKRVRWKPLLARQRSRLPKQRREVLLVLLGRSESGDVNRVVRCRQQALVDDALAAALFLEREVGREHANALLVQRP